MKLLHALLAWAASAHDDSISLIQMHAARKPLSEGGKRPNRNQEDVVQKPFGAPPHAAEDTLAASGASAGTHDLKFTKVTTNNLNGLGPDTDADPVMRFQTCTTKDDRPVDCVITSNKGYKPSKAEKNGVKGKLGNINLKNNKAATFTVSFVDQQTDQPVTLNEFFFSLFDIDTGNGWSTDGSVKPAENLEISGYKDLYKLPVEKEGTIVKKEGAWSASDHGTEADNPTDPIQLTSQQIQRTVSFIFPAGKSSFSFKYTNDKAGPGENRKGRNVLFGGMTSLYMCKQKKVNLDFDLAEVTRNNLGNQGPEEGDEGVIYEKIATVGDDVIDLEVNAVGEYTAYNVSRNGKLGYYGQLNLQTGTEVELKFSLKNHATGEPYKADWMYFSLFDFDHAKLKGDYIWKEYMTLSGMSQMTLTDGTSIHVDPKGENYVLSSTIKGNGKDNPDDPMRLTDEQMSKSVALTFKDVTSWNMKFRVGPPAFKPKSGNPDGRNFLFAGKSSTDVCDLETYDDIVNVRAEHPHDFTVVGPHFQDAGDGKDPRDDAVHMEDDNMEEERLEGFSDDE